MSTPISIVFTPTAFKHVQKVLGNHSEYQGLRLSAKKSGCSGLAYLFDYVTQISSKDILVELSQKVIDEHPKDDVNSIQEQSIKVFIDAQWQPLFQNVTVDYIKRGLNARLECINPKEVARCGCGESFSIEAIE